MPSIYKIRMQIISFALFLFIYFLVNEFEAWRNGIIATVATQFLLLVWGVNLSPNKIINENRPPTTYSLAKDQLIGLIVAIVTIIIFIYFYR